MLRGFDVLSAAGGGKPDGATRASQTLVGQGAQALVSFGLAGGLAPYLQPGDLLIPEHIIDEGDQFACDPMLLAWLGGANITRMIAGRDIIATKSEKAKLYKATNAAAVDLESGAVARVACAHHLPFVVLRAVADPADRTIPDAALHALNVNGQIALPSILLSVLKNPAQIPSLIALGRDAARAKTALAQKLKILPRS